MGLFFLKKPETSVNPDEMTEQETEEWMQGFRLGYPLQGEPTVTIENPSGKHFRRGLAAGQKSFKQAGSPTTPYDYGN